MEKSPINAKKIPQFSFPICEKSLHVIFSQCQDFQLRPVWPGGDATEGVSVCWLDGIVSGQNISADVLRPLTDAARICGRADPEFLMEQLLRGAVWSCAVTRCDSMDDLVEALVGGSCAVVFDRAKAAVCFEVRTSNTRSVSEPTIEKTVKGGKDAFVEVLRTNTALVRRRIRSPSLKLLQASVGNKSSTPVNVMYLEGFADPGVVAELRRRLESIDVDGLTSAGNLELHIIDHPASPFPQLLHTERPDRFASGLLAGHVGILVDGLPMGFLLPATLTEFMKVAEDQAQYFLVASGLMLLRWLSALISVLFPALLVAVCMYHQEMIPSKLLLSMIEAKQKVPFSVATEVLAMLVAFELLMEAGIRLPDPVGDTVSIIGALIVGQSAVEARVVSPITIIVVATTAICGFTQPSRDLGAALRLLRFGMVFLAILFGLFGIAAGAAALAWYLCTLESFGLAYMAPLSEGGVLEILRAMRHPLQHCKKRGKASSGQKGAPHQ